MHFEFAFHVHEPKTRYIQTFLELQLHTYIEKILYINKRPTKMTTWNRPRKCINKVCMPTAEAEWCFHSFAPQLWILSTVWCCHLEILVYFIADNVSFVETFCCWISMLKREQSTEFTYICQIHILHSSSTITKKLLWLRSI